MGRKRKEQKRKNREELKRRLLEAKIKIEKNDPFNKERDAKLKIYAAIGDILKIDPVIDNVYDDLNFRGHINPDTINLLLLYLKVKKEMT